jgi:hypothetical protein
MTGSLKLRDYPATSVRLAHDTSARNSALDIAVWKVCTECQFYPAVEVEVCGSGSVLEGACAQTSLSLQNVNVRDALPAFRITVK